MRIRRRRAGRAGARRGPARLLLRRSARQPAAPAPGLRAGGGGAAVHLGGAAQRHLQPALLAQPGVLGRLPVLLGRRPLHARARRRHRLLQALGWAPALASPGAGRRARHAAAWRTSGLPAACRAGAARQRPCWPPPSITALHAPPAGNYTGPWYNLGANNSAEPNNAENQPEECAVADYLERYQDPAAGEAGWGWNDQNCNMDYPFICRYKPGGCPGGCLCAVLCGRRAPCSSPYRSPPPGRSGRRLSQRRWCCSRRSPRKCMAICSQTLASGCTPRPPSTPATT